MLLFEEFCQLTYGICNITRLVRSLVHLSSLNGSCPVLNAMLCTAAQLLQRIARGPEHPSYVIIGDTCEAFII